MISNTWTLLGGFVSSSVDVECLLERLNFVCNVIMGSINDGFDV